MRAATYLLAAWVVLSLPAALLFGACIGGNDEAPAPEEDDAGASGTEQLLDAQNTIVPEETR